MDRRRFLLTLAAELAVAATGRGAVSGTRAGQGVPVASPGPASPSPASAVEALEPPGTLLPPTGVVTELPGAGNGLALTIDDGTSSEVVAAFAAFAIDSGVRLTLFPNGCYRSWAENAAVLGPLAESVFMPFMTDGSGAEWIGGWFGTGPERGIALLFTLAGLIGIMVTLAARASRSIQASRRRSAACGLRRWWSMRMPWSRSHAPAW